MSNVKSRLNPSVSEDAPCLSPQGAASEGERPAYAAAFRCIGPECEDTCCRNWRIPLDKATYERYRQFPPGKLGSAVSQSIAIGPPGTPDNLFAQIVPEEGGFCPFFDADRLCAIQKEYGGALLSTTCSVYPRALNRVGGMLEGALMLSCPQAARDVLLAPDLMGIGGDLHSGEFRTDGVIRLAEGTKLYGSFLPVRALLVEMVKDRARPLWQRLVLIGSLCKGLDEAAADDGEEGVRATLKDHRRALQHRGSCTELESVAPQPAMRLSLILRLTDERARDRESGKRFRDTFWTFVEGIGASGDSKSGSDLERYMEAGERYAGPFFRSRPFILENYLLNYIFANLFPFGRGQSTRYTPRGMFDEYILMATQFAWVETLLIGVAGHHKEDFAEEHVVHVVQSFCRAVEHNGCVLKSINELVAHFGLHDLPGMATLLRS